MSCMLSCPTLFHSCVLEARGRLADCGMFLFFLLLGSSSCLHLVITLRGVVLLCLGLQVRGTGATITDQKLHSPLARSRTTVGAPESVPGRYQSHQTKRPFYYKWPRSVRKQAWTRRDNPPAPQGAVPRTHQADRKSGA